MAVRDDVGRPLWNRLCTAASGARNTIVLVGLIASPVSGILSAGEAPSLPVAPILKKNCFVCHGPTTHMGGINLQEMSAQADVGASFDKWEKVASVLEQKRMPPPKMPQPPEEQRAEAINWVRSSLKEYARKHDGDPGRITVRRLTSGEYGYTIQDLTGLDLNVEKDLVNDEVGGEGFTNFADVQFTQDANIERYLEVAKSVADRAVIGAGPLTFFQDPGKTGFEVSAITRIQKIYKDNGFRTVSGEGGQPFGLERYGKALFVAWTYKNRVALGRPTATLKTLAEHEGIAPRFAEHMWTVMNAPALMHPSLDVAQRWRKLPAAVPGKPADLAAVRKDCEDIQKYLTTWPSWLFARGDVAAGGAGDERPLMFNDESLRADVKHRFKFVRTGRRGGPKGPPPVTGGVARIYMNVVLVNPKGDEKPSILWRNPTIQFRPAKSAAPTVVSESSTASGSSKPPAGDLTDLQLANPRFPGADKLPRVPLLSVVTEESAAKLAFGKSLDDSTLSPADFASLGSTFFDVKVPDGVSVFELQVDAEVGSNHDQVLRVTFSDRADGSTRGVPVWGLVGDPKSDGYRGWKAGVLQFAHLLPPNSNGEATPADKDPIPEPFDNTYNVPEHDDFVIKVKYIRDDRFLVDHVLDAATRARLDQAWNDLYSSFEYHDSYLRLLAAHFKYDLKGRLMAKLTRADVEAMPDPLRQYVRPLFIHYGAVMAAEGSGQAGHLDDCLRFAGRAWRRPLTAAEKLDLRAFYNRLRKEEELDHQQAIRALLTRILVSPAFLYRVETASQQAGVRPLTNWELASRLSYFLWSSMPDDELRRAAAAGELSNPPLLRKQVKRMLADARSRRMATEFFGQWLGFYRFDQHRGVDTTRFPEFTDDVKSAMYDESISFFEHIIRQDRPVRDILHADYTFLNQALARHYGIQKEIKSKDQMELVEGAPAFQRGGVLRLGTMLTVTSAPLRTSPVKRGDYVLRRILGTPTPPPPADAGTIPADEKAFGGLSLREKLKAHQRNATCAACHTRIDPLGFPLERYDAVGRARTKYNDGKPVEDTSATADNTQIAGVDGLLKYLDTKQDLINRTMARKLIGYALGRTILGSDQSLVERLSNEGPNATFSQLVNEVVASKQFQFRRGPEPTPVRPPAGSTSSAAVRSGGSRNDILSAKAGAQ
ncbi:DUF1592 domain-containing protein [uncultured Paludibaculum sp.]|uniref:DUF1592 domain-containing protein n=1 Tax=uncultured Paludibaculum sp. TaxID=1765020 RepID=UPI002AABB8FF|nr:DUF1592 domain-containing protein [uncultured Paludibaculum sp.]